MSSDRLKALVFGQTGQVARALALKADALNWDVTCLDRHAADFADPESVLAALENSTCDAVINAVAYTAVDQAETDEAVAYRVNAEIPGLIARHCAAHNKAFAHVSTDYVFSGDADTAYTEAAATGPVSAYGRTKLAGEEAVQQSGATAIILRTAWVYSETGKNFLKTMLRLAQQHPALRVVDDQVGCPTHAADIAEALLTATRQLTTMPDLAGVYHLAGPSAMSWADFANLIFEQNEMLGGPNPDVARITTSEFPTPAARPANSRLDSSKFSDTFGYSAAPVEHRVRETLQELAALES